MIRDEVERIEADRRAQALNATAPVVAAAAAIAWFAVWRRWGKEPTRSADIGDYWREIPEESPAVVAAIDDWGVISPSAFASTVIDLAQRGWLTVTEETGRAPVHPDNRQPMSSVARLRVTGALAAVRRWKGGQ